MNTDLKNRAAKEAANLLYSGAEKEYKQAKIHAAQTLGTHFLPSNLEVALELDRIAEENEGNRVERLVQMRREALQVMKILDVYRPLLLGSVWRGTIRRGSDIDIAAYADDPQEIVDKLTAAGLKIQKTERTKVNKHGRTLSSLHLHAETESGHGLEIVVRAEEESGERRKCEIFGDEIKGLKTKELERLLRDNPAQKFIPA